MAYLKDLYLSTRFSDITIIASGERLPAHRCILAQNEYFNALFNSKRKDSTADTIVLDLSAEHAKMMLAVIYGKSIPNLNVIHKDATKSKQILHFMCNTRKYMMQKYFYFYAPMRAESESGLLVKIGLEWETEFAQYLGIGELESIFEMWIETLNAHNVKSNYISCVPYIKRYIDLATQPDTIGIISANMVVLILKNQYQDLLLCCIDRLVELWLQHNNDPISLRIVTDALTNRITSTSVYYHKTVKPSDYCDSCRRIRDGLVTAPVGTKMDALSTALLEHDEIDL